MGEEAQCLCCCCQIFSECCFKSCCESCCECCAGCCASQNLNNNDCIFCFKCICGTCINFYTCISESCDLTNCFLCVCVSSTYHYLYNNTKYTVPKQIISINDDNIFKINSLCIIEVQNNEI